MKKTYTVLSFIWRAMKKYRGYALVTFILYGGFIVIGDAIVPVYIKKITDTIQSGLFSNTFTIMYILIGIYFLQRVLAFSSMHVLSFFESKLSRDLHNLSFGYFINHSYNFYNNQPTGSLVEKTKRLGTNVINIIDTILFGFFGLAVSVISILILLFIENIIIGFIFIGFLIIYSFIIQWMGKKMSPIYEDRSIAKTKFNSVVSDIIMNIHSVLFFSSHQGEINNLKKVNENFHQKRYHAWKSSINFQDSFALLPTIFTWSITLYGIHLASIGDMSIGSVILIFLLGNSFDSQIWRINRSIKEFVSSISDCVESIEIIEKIPTVLDSRDPIDFNPIQGNIALQNINFTYPGGDHVFDDFNLEIPSQQSIGIVGKSGSGKTTITKLLLRLYDLQQGKISYDNIDIRHIRQHDLRINIAYVPQETMLLHRTVFENIAYGSPNATDEEIYTAAKLANVEEFVQGFADGYQTMVGERGVKLSGGQRQRIGIARAMLKKNAPVLIMDEATSSLDTLSEQYIKESFEKLSKGRTTIVIAHRLSTIQNLDRIIVLDQGSIVEDGSHEELISLNGHYAELWNSQNSEHIIP